jgi:hypothetical protein
MSHATKNVFIFLLPILLVEKITFFAFNIGFADVCSLWVSALSYFT